MSVYANTTARNFTPEQNREFKRRHLDRRRAYAIADLLSGIPQDVDQEEWEEWHAQAIQENVRDIGKGDAFICPAGQIEECRGQEVLVRGESHLKWAQIHNPTNSLVFDAQVIEDSGTGVNFIHPALAQACGLRIYPTAPTVHKVITGQQFRSDKWAQVEWMGKPGRLGTDWFYLAPEEAPIQLLVGRRFLKENKGVFLNEKPEVDPVLLNVQTKKTVRS
ncbi:hypothetical protein JX265_010186 [Neoarthrinium moseri]|uniref:Uncharacterized protein n=1 Tax=Neoarthrinium moseri TaxID=1658444 RepID=A0A9P9WEN2_9PEZI|nr:uncharacterized protein JN550_010427 [Neoarthrinium moseri]KAI1844383.1 hypothetical protein JX266_009477 [Neoarthrinium moseri]KAI1859737.1 hypothetical protein JX265_010186 [Neoarthrinium moseri]KAI1862124.1 hypothetical protein JN550_010427 [Neoarthrinium moseri]